MTRPTLAPKELDLLKAIAGQGNMPCGSDDPEINASMRKLCGMKLLKPTCFLDGNMQVGKAKLTVKYTATAAGRKAIAQSLEAKPA